MSESSPELSSIPPRPAAAHSKRVSRGAIVAVTCGLLLLAYAGLAYTAVRSKSPTYDEPLHALAAWMHIYQQDFRVDPEDPPLWHYWAALSNGPKAIKVDTGSKRFADVLGDIYHEWPFVVETLYPCGRGLPRDSGQCPDSDLFVLRSRRMMLALAVGLGAVIAWWGWQVGGGVAAVVATLFFAFDPNFLGHGPLVKNDVALSLVASGLFLAVWRAGRQLTPWNGLAIALLCAAAVTVKFSGLLLGPIVAALLLLRAVTREPWESSWRRIELRSEKLVVALALIVAAASVSYGGIWAAYQFRFGPAADPAVQFDMPRMGSYAAMAELTVQYGRPPTDAEIDLWTPSRMTRAVIALNQFEFLPQAWLYGLLYTYQSALARDTFLLGEFSKTGWWYYFPLAMLFKTPLATLTAMGLSVAVWIAAMRSEGRRAVLTWSAACLLLPPAIYLASAMRSNLNLGLRHVLPVYPFIFVGIGWAAAYAWRRWRTMTPRLAFVLALGLATETLVAFPNFIAFFNTVAGGSRGGLKLLGDSNLDWGQDLKLLAQWQQDHPETNLYLVYFGLADPWAYDIEYVNFPSGYGFGVKHELRMDPGVLAISATKLQGIYQDDVYAPLRQIEPLAVLGGTIYLYDWPPPPMKRIERKESATR
ncbi:MAG: hypothetical protein ABIP55_11395 [Tepidisphaeraceae bacterium]